MRLDHALGAKHFAVASGAILFAFAICEGLHALSHADLHVHPHPHAVFLPHGVLIVLTWVYGWAAMPMVFPAAILSAWLLAGATVFDPTNLLILSFKLAATGLAFDLFRLAGMDARGVGPAANWKVLVAVGLVGSLLGNVPRAISGPCCVALDGAGRLAAYVDMVAGDIAGLILVLLTVMLVFRALRHG